LSLSRGIAKGGAGRPHPSKGTRSAKRKLQKLSGRERRFQRDVNHQIANWIVSKPYDVIALEDLTNIRNGKKNKKLGKWSFSELRGFVEYKAAAIGKKVVAINPRYTSLTCSKCGFQTRENRNGRTFKCKRCGFQIDADLNASRNIAAFSRSDRSRLSANQPIVASKDSYKPLPSGRGS